MEEMNKKAPKIDKRRKSASVKKPKILPAKVEEQPGIHYFPWLSRFTHRKQRQSQNLPEYRTPSRNEKLHFRDTDSYKP